MTKQLTPHQIQNNTGLLIEASNLGSVDIVKKLIPVSEPKTDNSAALRYAAYYGHTEIIQLLIPVSDPKADASSALKWAAYNKHLDAVKLLIPVSDPKANDSEALQWTAKIRHIEIVKLLIPVSDYLHAEQQLIYRSVDTTFLRQHIDEYEALLQKERLTHQLNSNLDYTQHSSVKRKM